MDSFPIKLHCLLDNAEQEGYAHCARWNDDGKSFRIDDPIAFTEILRKEGKITKFKSFLRQLQHYGMYLRQITF